jgi:hypothetical protein
MTLAQSTRRSKTPTAAELAAQLQDTKKQLRAARASERLDHIARMGSLAHKAGLAVYDSTTLLEQFTAVAKSLASALVLMLVLTCSACTSRVPSKPSVSDYYAVTMTMIPITLPDGSEGTTLSVKVRPPHPGDPVEEGIARRYEDEFLRRMQSDEHQRHRLQ